MSMLPAGGEGCAREEARVSTGQVGSPGDLLHHGFVTPRIRFSIRICYSMDFFYNRFDFLTDLLLHGFHFSTYLLLYGFVILR